MFPNTPPEGSDDPEISQIPASQWVSGSQETVEAPSLRVEVVEACASEGRYLGLGGKQRRALNVELGDVVVASQDGQAIGLFVVGKGKKAVLKQSGKCTGNLPEGISGSIQLQPVTKQMLEERTFDFSVLSSPESDLRHEGRLEKIAERFPELEQGSYVVIPTSLAILLDAPYMNPDRKTLRMIFKGNLKVGGQVRELALVPSGDGIAFTSFLVEKLRMKDVTQIYLGIQDGVLVVDKVSDV
jgi:hypothetical protein